MRILIAEDNPILSRLFSRIFTLRGWAADESPSVSSAMRRFDKGRYDLALCDIELPDGDGISLAKALLQAQPTLSVIMTSGTPGNLERARAAGLAQCLPKPFARAELLDLIDLNASLLSRRAETQRLGAPDCPVDLLGPAK